MADNKPDKRKGKEENKYVGLLTHSKGFDSELDELDEIDELYEIDETKIRNKTKELRKELEELIQEAEERRKKFKELEEMAESYSKQTKRKSEYQEPTASGSSDYIQTKRVKLEEDPTDFGRDASKTESFKTDLTEVHDKLDKLELTTRKDNKETRSSLLSLHRKFQYILTEIPGLQLEDSTDDPNDGLQSDDDTIEEQSRHWTIDINAWKDCIGKGCTDTLKELLRQRKVPDGVLLHKALKTFKADSDCVRLICNGLCIYIAQTSSHILNVYPAGKPSDKVTLTFVVVIDTDDIDLPPTYKYHIKNISGPHPRENIEIRNQEMRDMGNKTFVDDPSMLTKCIDKHSSQLAKFHSNICRITYSGYKWKEDESKLEKVDCIALYVYVKGWIPIGEELLPQTLEFDGRRFPVDVREGYVYACQGKGPTDTFDNLVMGCSIGVEPRTKDITMSGTLGGFFELGGDDFCISAAHSFLTANELRRLNQKDGFKFFNKNFYQPYDNYIKPFGKYNSSVYMEGGFNKVTGESVTGVDVICIKMDNRHPKTGGFPKAIDGGQEPHTEYVNGKVYSRQEIYEAIKENPDRRFFKYGCGTGWTTGRFRGDGAMFRTPHPKPEKHDDFIFTICLHKQIEIWSETESDFAGKSDSGSLVFMEVNDELVAIGMVVASMPVEFVSFVTPLDEILKALNLRAKGMKTFTKEAQASSESSEQLPSPNAEISDLKDDMSKVKSDIQAMQSSVSSLKSGMSNMESGLSEVKTDVSSLKKSSEETNEGIKVIMGLLQNLQVAKK